MNSRLPLSRPRARAKARASDRQKLNFRPKRTTRGLRIVIGCRKFGPLTVFKLVTAFELVMLNASITTLSLPLKIVNLRSAPPRWAVEARLCA